MIGKFAAAKLSLFGMGSIEGLGPYIEREHLKRAFIITDKTLHKLNLLDPILSMLDEIKVSYEIYDNVLPNPTIENVNSGVELMKKNQCDFIISVGGGSVNDCAKAIRVLEANGGSIYDYVGGNKSKYLGKYHIAVNTTAGTASEVSRAYLISDEEKKVKLIFKDDYAMPDIAVNDIQLMMKLPKSITAQTGMDALTHAVESYICTSSILLTDILAVESIKLILGNLEDAVEEMDNKTARENMALGQYLAGLSFGSAGLGLVHAMAHQIGAFYHLPHGLCNAILLPVVLEYYFDVCKGKYAELFDKLHLESEIALEEDKKARSFLLYIEKLSMNVGTKISLLELGVEEKDLPELAENASKDGCITTSPKIPDKQEIITLYKKVMYK